jgi:integrase
VAALAKPPTVPRNERRWLSGDELRALFDATDDVGLNALWVLAGTTGLRSAELLGLAWRDVDLEAGRLTVRHTLHRHNGEWVFRPTKTRATRSVPLPERALRALRSHRVRQGAPGGLVFTTESGRPLHGPNLAKLLRRDLQAAGLPVVTVHQLRHSAASWWLSTGSTIQEVAKLLGHSDPRITATLYAHVGDDALKEGARRIDAALER